MGKKTKLGSKKKDQGKKKKGKDKKGGQKKKKPMKRIGLAKFMHHEPIKKKSDVSEEESNLANQLAAKEAHETITHLKSEKKNLGIIDRCKLQMSSSLLRLIDEDLYTSDTKHVPLDEEKFLAYHEAYASVCDKWPTKPIDYIVKFIKKRLLSKKPVSKYLFADIGCGKEPLLKMKLPPKAKVQSFDLVSVHEHITRANMEKLPLKDESIHCAVYSLSLMAKNLGNVILEAKRILKPGGSMLIVEVTSRFEGKETRFIGKLDRLGFKKKSVAQLKPNGYFTFFHFTKIDSKMDYSGSSLKIELKPCIYKAR